MYWSDKDKMRPPHTLAKALRSDRELLDEISKSIRRIEDMLKSLFADDRDDNAVR